MFRRFCVAPGSPRPGVSLIGIVLVDSLVPSNTKARDVANNQVMKRNRLYEYNENSVKLIVGRCIPTPKFQDSRFWGRLKAKSISGEQYWELRHRDASIDHTACSPSHMRPRCEQHLACHYVSLKLTPVLTTVQLFDVMLFAWNCMIVWNVDGLRRTCLS